MEDRMAEGTRRGSEVPTARKKRFSRRNIALAAVLTLVLAGGAVASVAAVSEGSKRPRHARGVAVGRRDLAAASAYLGVSEEQLASDLRSGKSLAQVAQAIPGRSASGLVAALVSAKRERLATVGARAQARATAEVQRSGPGSLRTGRHRQPAGRGPSPSTGAHGALPRTGGRLGDAAASYLGVTPAQLESQLVKGRTLGQVADGIKGKSASGLVNALVAARREWITASVGAGRLTPERAKSIEARLLRRVTRLVGRPFARG
jgi:hypothetical protein